MQCKLKSILFLFILIWANNLWGQETYEVVSTSILNVRNKPTTKSIVIGKLKVNDEVEVFSIVNNWAEIIYKNRKAYVSSQYLKKVAIGEIKYTGEQIAQDSLIDILDPREIKNDNISQQQKKEGKIGIDFLPMIYGGVVNLVSDKISPKGNIGGGVDFVFQFFAKERFAFVPQNYYMEASLGYSLRGSGQFPLHYIMVKASPIGYRYPISDFILCGNIGAYVGYTFSTIETNIYSFDSNVDWGVLARIGVEHKKIGIAFSYERGFNNVCNSNLKLKNQGIFLSISYRTLNLK